MDIMNTTINHNACPYCGGVLRFDIHDSKHHCTVCKKIWSFEIDIHNNTLITKEWISTDLPTPIKGHKYYVAYHDGTKEVTEKPECIKDGMLAKNYVDLTKMFGEGNEPKDAETFENMMLQTYDFYYECC